MSWHTSVLGTESLWTRGCIFSMQWTLLPGKTMAVLGERPVTTLGHDSLFHCHIWSRVDRGSQDTPSPPWYSLGSISPREDRSEQKELSIVTADSKSSTMPFSRSESAISMLMLESSRHRHHKFCTNSCDLYASRVYLAWSCFVFLFSFLLLLLSTQNPLRYRLEAPFGRSFVNSR